MAIVKKDRGDFLSIDDIKTGDMVTIIGEALDEDTDWGKRLQVPVTTPKGEKKTFGLNKTTRNVLIEVYGEDTNAWVGKKIEIELLSQNVRGKIRKVIYGHPEGHLKKALEEATQENMAGDRQDGEEVPF